MVPSLLWEVLIPSHMVFTSPIDVAAVPVEMLYSSWTSDQKQTVWEITYDVVTWVGNEYYLVQLTTLIAVYWLVTGTWDWAMQTIHDPVIDCWQRVDPWTYCMILLCCRCHRDRDVTHGCLVLSSLKHLWRWPLLVSSTVLCQGMLIDSLGTSQFPLLNRHHLANKHPGPSSTKTRLCFYFWTEAPGCYY